MRSRRSRSARAALLVALRRVSGRQLDARTRVTPRHPVAAALPARAATARRRRRRRSAPPRRPAVAAAPDKEPDEAEPAKDDAAATTTATRARRRRRDRRPPRRRRRPTTTACWRRPSGCCAPSASPRRGRSSRRWPSRSTTGARRCWAWPRSRSRRRTTRSRSLGRAGGRPRRRRQGARPAGRRPLPAEPVQGSRQGLRRGAEARPRERQRQGRPRAGSKTHVKRAAGAGKMPACALGAGFWPCGTLAVGAAAVGAPVAMRRHRLAVDLATPRDLHRVAYVGSAACRDCHLDHLASWKRTFHRTMTAEATPAVREGRLRGRDDDLGGRHGSHGPRAGRTVPDDVHAARANPSASHGRPHRRLAPLSAVPGEDRRHATGACPSPGTSRSSAGSR